MIFNVQRYSTHDGPGIRTVVFLKGCSLSCVWCQNPESRSAKPELLFDKRLCITGCSLCSQRLPHALTKIQDELIIHRQRLQTGDYALLKQCCPSQALTVCGATMSLDEIMHIINKDAIYYQRSEGGVTLSGGEPFMQPKLSQAILQRCKAQAYHTAVESCLHVPWRAIAPALPYIDLFLADLKHTDPAIFLRWTKGSATRILTNFRRLAQRGKNVIVRVPLIQGFNADKRTIKAIIDFTADETNSQTIHFLPYHTLGKQKYHLLDLPYHAPDQPLADPAILDYAMQYAEQKNIHAVLRG